MAQQHHFFREWRKFRALTQQQLADRVDLSKPQVSRLETGKQNYTQETLEAFADALGVTAAELLSPPPDPSRPESEFEILARRIRGERLRARAARVLKALLEEDAA